MASVAMLPENIEQDRAACSISPKFPVGVSPRATTLLQDSMCDLEDAPESPGPILLLCCIVWGCSPASWTAVLALFPSVSEPPFFCCVVVLCFLCSSLWLLHSVHSIQDPPFWDLSELETFFSLTTSQPITRRSAMSQLPSSFQMMPGWGRARWRLTVIQLVICFLMMRKHHTFCSNYVLGWDFHLFLGQHYAPWFSRMAIAKLHIAVNSKRKK